MSNVIYNYPKLCKDVKNLNKKIKFAGVINERGRLVACDVKKGTHMVNEKDEEMLFMELALRVRMRRNFEDRLGKVSYSLTVRDKHIGMNFPIKEDFLYVAIDHDANLIELHLKIIETIKSQEKASKTI